MPIIFLTAYYNEDQHVLEGYGSGAVDYLHKPVNAPVLRSKVAVFAELHRKSREIEVSNRALLAEVTERRRAEEQLQELNENLDRLVDERTRALEQLEAELREAGRRKDEFIATLAHELRNPLAPVRNAAQLLQYQKDLAAPARKARRRHRPPGAGDVAPDRRPDGREPHQPGPDRAAPGARRPGERGRPGGGVEPAEHPRMRARAGAAPARGADRARRRSDPAVAGVRQPAHQCRQVHRSRRPHRARRPSCEDAEVRITVSDDGIGIPADELPNVFAMFAQVEGALTRSRGGLGIGLTLVKHLVELHGGRVEALSAGVGQGSAFVVTLPLPAPGRAAASVGPEAAAAAACGPMKILVVDDHQDGAESMSALLALQGHEVRMAHDGEAALAAADAFRPDVMLLDIGLPLLSGYEVCRRLREQPWGRQITVIALTGWGDQDAVMKGETAGFDRHLVKPVDEAVLVATLAGLPPPRSRDALLPMTSTRPFPPVPRRRRFLAGLTALAFTPLMTSCGGDDGDAGGPGIPSGPTVPPAPGVAGPAWWGFGRDAQHSAVSAIATQDLNRIAWSTPLDLDPQYRGSGGPLLTHYGSPVITSNNTVVLPVKTGANGGFRIEARSGVNGGPIWSATTDYLLPAHNWIPSYNLALATGNRLYAPGAGGKLLVKADADSPNGALQTVVFFGAAAYAAAPALYDSSVFINTPITVDPLGNVFFGFIVTAANPAGLESGIARIGADGVGSWVSARIIAGDPGVAKMATNSAPALSPDLGTLYVAVNANPVSGTVQGGYLLALDSATLALRNRALLIDPGSGAPRPRQRRQHRVADGRARRRRLLRRSRDGVRHAQRPRLAAPLRRHARHRLHARRLRLGRHRVGGADARSCRRTPAARRTC